MLGLSVLFFLGIWITITIVAMVIGSKFGRKPATKFLGAFLGFMLTMGGFIIHWTIEYYQIKNYVTSTCETEGGVKVYVTPEEFKERLKSNNWEGLPKYTTLPKGDEQNEEYILFEGKEYKGFRTDTSIPKITIYDYWDFQTSLSTSYYEELYVFNQSNVVLIKNVSLNTGTGNIANNLHGLKFWINNIQDCRTSDPASFSEKIDLYRTEIKNEK